MEELDKDNSESNIASATSANAPNANSMPNMGDLKRPEMRGGEGSGATEDAQAEQKFAPPPPPRPNAAPQPNAPMAALMPNAPMANKAPLGFSAPSTLSMLNATAPELREKPSEPAELPPIIAPLPSTPPPVAFAPPPPPPARPFIQKFEEEEKPLPLSATSDFVPEDAPLMKDNIVQDIINMEEAVKNDFEPTFAQSPEPTEPLQLQEPPQLQEPKEEMSSPLAAPHDNVEENNNSISQVVFDEILRQHNEWVQSDGKEGRRANLHGLDLRHINFIDADLQQSNMRATLLSGANLSRTILIDADLTEAMLDGAQAIGANWSRINLSNANLSGANLSQTNFAYANFFRANFYVANLEETNLESANLRDAIMVNADFSNAYLKDAVCRGADLTQTIFKRTNLTNVDMRECICNATVFVETVLDNTSFKNAHFEGMSFTGSDFTNALDIPLEYQNKGFKLEKENIEQEKNELKNMEAEIGQKQKELLEMRLQMEEQRNLIGSVKADEQVYIGSLQGILSHLKIIRIMWGVVLLLVLGCTGLTLVSFDMESLNMMELGLVLIVPIALILLVLYTFSQVASARKRIMHHSMIRERKIAMLQQSPASPTFEKPSFEKPAVVPVLVKEKIAKVAKEKIKKNKGKS